MMNLRCYSLVCCLTSGQYPHRCETYLKKGSSWGKLTLRSSKKATNYSFIRWPSGRGRREISSCWAFSTVNLPVFTSSTYEGSKCSTESWKKYANFREWGIRAVWLSGRRCPRRNGVFARSWALWGCAWTGTNWRVLAHCWKLWLKLSVRPSCRTGRSGWAPI